MALVYQETRAEAVCSLEQDVLVLLNDKSRMKGDLHVRFREKFEVKVLLLTRLEREGQISPIRFSPRIFKILTEALQKEEPAGQNSCSCNEVLLGFSVSAAVCRKISKNFTPCGRLIWTWRFRSVSERLFTNMWIRACPAM